MMKYVLKNLNLTEMIYMNWLEIYHVMMMKELYDISTCQKTCQKTCYIYIFFFKYVVFLRFLRDLEKWSWILSLRKNEGKLG